MMGYPRNKVEEGEVSNSGKKKAHTGADARTGRLATVKAEVSDTKNDTGDIKVAPVT